MQTHTEDARSGFSMNNAIGWILQGGVLLSAAVICAGIGLWILGVGQQAHEPSQVFPHTLSGVWNGLVALHPQAIITLGLLLLLATPVVRVFASVFAFALE